MRFACLLLGVLVGCSGGSAPTGPDAQIFCARTTYDPCNSEHDCDGTVCETLESVQVCTLACSATGSACPMHDGSAVPCGSAGFCDPPAVTMCTLNP